MDRKSLISAAGRAFESSARWLVSQFGVLAEPSAPLETIEPAEARDHRRSRRAAIFAVGVDLRAHAPRADDRDHAAATRGNVGIAEVVYVGGFVALAGSDSAALITAGVLLQRLALWLLPIPIGWITA